MLMSLPRVAIEAPFLLIVFILDLLFLLFLVSFQQARHYEGGSKRISKADQVVGQVLIILEDARLPAH